MEKSQTTLRSKSLRMDPHTKVKTHPNKKKGRSTHVKICFTCSMSAKRTLPKTTEVGRE